MIMHFYAYQEKKLELFTRPLIVEFPPEVFAEVVTRQYKSGMLKDSPALKIKNCDLVYIGQFDDHLGKMIGVEPTPIVQFDCLTIEPSYIPEEEVKDGQEDKIVQ